MRRLGCDLFNVTAVRKVAGISFNLAMEMLGDLAALQFQPSLLAAAILYAARKMQVSHPDRLVATLAPCTEVYHMGHWQHAPGEGLHTLPCQVRVAASAGEVPWGIVGCVSTLFLL